MADETFDREFWERRWAQALGKPSDEVAGRPPNAHLVADVANLVPGLALDAGCGHGTEAIWFASSGWRVSAVDFSTVALEHARERARAVGTEIAGRIEWNEVDLGNWVPPRRHFDLVSCLYVHAATSVGDLVARLSSGVAPGGTLFLVGHLPVDPSTGERSPAAGQVQVTVEEAVGALAPGKWMIATAEERSRPDGRGADAVVRALRVSTTR